MKELGCAGVREGLVEIPCGSGGVGRGAGEAMAESHDMVGRTEVGEAVACLLKVMGAPRMLVGEEPSVTRVSNTEHREKMAANSIWLQEEGRLVRFSTTRLIVRP